MPELPEVETVRRIIAMSLVGHRVSEYDLRLPKLLRDSPLPNLDPLVNQRIIGVSRRAKVLSIAFDNDLTLMMHMKLSGQFAVFLPNGERCTAGHPVPLPSGSYPHKTTHLTIRFDDGRIAYYSDVRQFGWLRLYPAADVAAIIASFRFGPEGVGDYQITHAELTAKLTRRSIPIKQALLDQTIVAGLGNIYVDEALFEAMIHPARPANSMTDNELTQLIRTIPWALERGIEQGGATIINHRAYPRDGFPQIHAREGEPCVRCKTPVVKTRVGGRGTYLCPICQAAPPDWVAPARGKRTSVPASADMMGDIPK